MDLVDEQHVARLEVREDRRQVAGALKHRPGSLAQVDAHLARDDVRERGFAKPWRPEEQHMIERFVARPGGLDEDLELAAYFFLPHVIGQRRRAKRAFDLLLLRRGGLGRDQAVGFYAHVRILPEPSMPRGCRPRPPYREAVPWWQPAP